jgi:hypothetical protein
MRSETSGALKDGGSATGDKRRKQGVWSVKGWWWCRLFAVCFCLPSSSAQSGSAHLDTGHELTLVTDGVPEALIHSNFVLTVWQREV